MRRTWHLFAIAAIVLVFGLTLPPVSVRSADSTTVTLSVDASESFGNPLSYQWRATDGHIVHPDALTTDWILPNGPGIHFAYVLISNGKGGFTEGRIAINTDKSPTSTVVPRDQYPVVQQFHAAPTADPSDPQIKGTVRLEDGSVCGTRNPFFDVYVTAEVTLIPPTFGTPQSRATLNPYADGQFAISDNLGVNPSGAFFIVACQNASLIFNNFSRTDPSKNNFIIQGSGRPVLKSISATPKGTNIGISVPPLVPPGILPSDDLAGREGNKLTGPPSRFLAFKGLDTRAGSCQYYKSVGAVEGCDFAGNYTGKTLTFDEWRKSVQIDEFCDKRTNPICTKIPFQASAVFVNKADLNLTRDHHSVEIAPSQLSAMPGQLAAYVCNHSGPAPDPKTDPTGLFPSPSSVDAAIDAVLQGQNLIACVAMDRVPITSVTGQHVTGQGGEIFTRFLIFGPNGDLLPSVNLDGNGEKFVPGACVACHGGTGYFALANNTPFTPAAFQPLFGGFPESGVIDGADLFSYFLPYDVDNFEFHSSRQGSRKNDQQEAIFWLNFYAKDSNIAIADYNFTGTNDQCQATAFKNLFNGWYAPPGSHVFVSRMDNQHAYVPPAIDCTTGLPTGQPLYQDSSFYLDVVAPSCRTCHIAMDQANFDREMPPATVQNLVCGKNALSEPQGIFGRESSYVMPNSQVTFDRFWLSDRSDVVGQPTGTPHQPDILRKHYNLSCGPPPPPT